MAPVPTVAMAAGNPGFGAVAQLGERRVRNAEVRGSIPLGSTNPLLFRSAHAEPVGAGIWDGSGNFPCRLTFPVLRILDAP